MPHPRSPLLCASKKGHLNMATFSPTSFVARTFYLSRLFVDVCSPSSFYQGGCLIVHPNGLVPRQWRLIIVYVNVLHGGQFRINGGGEIGRVSGERVDSECAVRGRGRVFGDEAQEHQ